LQAEIAWGLGGLRTKVAAALGPPSNLTWPAAAVAAGVVVGALVAKGQTKFAILPLCVVLAICMSRIPPAGYIAILWSVGTAVDLLALPQLGVSSLQFQPAEVLLWVAIGCLVFLPADIRAGLLQMAGRGESIAVAVFLGTVAAGVAVGVMNGASVHAAAFQMRYMLFYAAFWPALAALMRGRTLVFKLVGAGVCLVVALQVVQVLVGPSTTVFWIAASDVTSSLTQDTTGFLRVRPPGLTTVYIVAAFALARVLWGPARGRAVGWWIAAVAIAGVILSLNRNMLIGLVLGISVATLAARPRHRVAVMAAGLAMLLCAAVLATEGTAVGSNAVVARIASITNYSELRTQTLDDRYYENEKAIGQLHAHPIGGLGWGPPYGALLESSDDGFLVTQPRSFMHEQYLWIWLRAGIVGLVALLTMLAFGVLTGIRWSRARAREADAWLGAGVVVSLVALAASSNVAIYLTPPDSTVPLVGVLALAALMRRDLQHGEPPAA